MNKITLLEVLVIDAVPDISDKSLQEVVKSIKEECFQNGTK